MKASATVRKSVVSVTVAAAMLAAGAAYSAERLGRDSVYANAKAAPSSTSGATVVIQRQGRSSVYAGDAFTSPRATVKVKVSPHFAGNGRGSVYSWSNDVRS
jgi:hypothetical protein